MLTFNDQMLIGAVFALVALTFGLLIWMGRERVPRVMRGEVAVGDIALDRTAYPQKARQLSNSFDNQFQLPVLFYLAVLLGLVVGGTSWLDVVLAWAFVILRIAHAAIHVTSNHVYRRFLAYVAGFGVLAALWIGLGVRVLTGAV